MRVVCYADDVVLFGNHKQAVQIALRTLERFFVGKGLAINREMTVAVKFRTAPSANKFENQNRNGESHGFRNSWQVSSRGY